MRRLTVTTAVLGVMVMAFLIPVALLFVGGVVLIVNCRTGGIAAVAGGFSFRSISASVLIMIVILAAVISWLTHKILRRRSSHR